MRLTVLACWGVVAALVVAVEGKPFAPRPFDIAAAYEAYHQLWMSEAQRNAVAPLSIGQQIARSWPRKQPAVTNVASPAPVAEKPPQEQITARSETEKAVVNQKTEEQRNTEQQTENQVTAEQQTPEMTTEVQTQETMTVEPTTTEQSVQEEVTTEMQTQEQTTQETNADTRSAIKQASPQVQSATPTSRSRPHMKAAFDNFFNRWNAERIRNSIPPVATPIPSLSSSYYNMKHTKLTKQPQDSKPVDSPAEAPANTPASESPVDTLTQKAASSAPVATAAAPPATDAVSLIKSLAQPGTWGEQGSAPLIIILQ